MWNVIDYNHDEGLLDIFRSSKSSKFIAERLENFTERISFALSSVLT